MEANQSNSSGKLASEVAELKEVVTADREANNENFKTIQQDMSTCFGSISNLEGAIKQAQEKTDEEVATVRSQLTLLQAEVKSSDRALHEDISRLIEITDMLKARPG